MRRVRVKAAKVDALPDTRLFKEKELPQDDDDDEGDDDVEGGSRVGRRLGGHVGSRTLLQRWGKIRSRSEPDRLPDDFFKFTHQNGNCHSRHLIQRRLLFESSSLRTSSSLFLQRICRIYTGRWNPTMISLTGERAIRLSIIT